MGLFGKLFDKKACAICGGEIGMLGNRKLEDGNLCKECASRLSPWFSERRHSTVQEIAEQLQYREANYERVRAFVPTRVFGDRECLFMDDQMQTFTITTANGLSRENPDIVDYSAYVSIKPEIREHRWEDHSVPKQEGMPPRYKYDYDFYLTIYVNHPYFDDMTVRLNSGTVKQIDWDACMRYVTMTEDAVEAMSGVRPDLSGSIRPFMPEPIPVPIPVPMQSVVPPHPAGAPQGRPMQPHPAPSPRPQAAPGPRPQPAAAPHPQTAPMPQQGGRPQSAPMNQPTGTRPQPGAPAARPQAPGFSGAGRSQAPAGAQPQKGPAPQGPAGRPGGRPAGK